MKITKLAATVFAGMLLAAEARAQVNIYLTGAVAFRSQTYSIITNLYGSHLSSQNPASGGASASVITWSGQITNLFGSQTVTVYANYNGAVAGIQNLTLNTPASFLQAGSGSNTVSSVADLAFSSVYQASTAYTTPTLNDSIFGVTPVLWLKSTNWPSGFTNITAQQIKELVSNGFLPASYFTGNSNDTGYVYFVTRDSSAGQRVIVFKDSGFSGSPAAYVNNGTTWVYDPTGQTSTGNIVTQLNKYGPSISYLTGVDAINATNATILSYNGVFPFKNSTTLSPTSNDFTPVITGKYSLWGYEHILSRTTASGNVATFLTALTTNLITSLNTYAYSIPKANVQVGRDSDGGLVYPLQ